VLLLAAACAIAIVGGRVVGETPALSPTDAERSSASAAPQTH
jgi:hypothetical protein